MAGTQTQTAVVLPNLEWLPTEARGSRDGATVVRVVVHRWGVAYTDAAGEAASYRGVLDFFADAANEASAHVVFPGSAVAGEAAQLVAWADKAWAEAAYNATSDDVESADALWLGHDPHGLAVLARIVACRLAARQLPATWSAERGFCRHADLGAAGGGHSACPTTDPAVWRAFCVLVEREAGRAGFRPVWGR